MRIGTLFYNVWRNIKARCNKPTKRNTGYKDVTYPIEWENFDGFMNDMYETYCDGLQIDRINPYGNYSKDNCRWVSGNINACNKRKMDNKSSKYMGVSFHKKTKKWQVELRFNNIRYYGGLFNNEIEAAKKVNEIIKKNNLPNRINNV